MNISRILRMASEGDMSGEAIRYLIDCRGECEGSSALERGCSRNATATHYEGLHVGQVSIPATRWRVRNPPYTPTTVECGATNASILTINY